uniref:Protein DPCD n=1 Tax=Cacopsylla melanoneura TaxID=428564 RepID=A0A8D9ACU9_9HEMI
MTLSSDWLSLLEKAEKAAILEDDVTLKVHYKFEDGREMAEEYDVRTKQLTRRAWRNKSNIHKDPNHWETELGEEIPSSTANVFTSMMRESSNSPYVIKKMEKEFIEWRIRNLSYALDNYMLDFNEEDNLKISTKNKKYYKVLPLLELHRLNLKPDKKLLSYKHEFNSLIIRYRKPTELIRMESKVYEMVRGLKMVNNKQDLPCKPS